MTGCGRPTALPSRTALDELERYTQARIGGNHPAETTGKFIAAKFEHDTARPVEGYAAPQLHTHAVIFNVTEREDGSTRALQPKSLFDTQNYATAVYQVRTDLSAAQFGLRDRDRAGAGRRRSRATRRSIWTLPAPAPSRSASTSKGWGTAARKSAQIAAHATRDRKQILTPEQVLAAHKAMAAEFGNQAEQVIAEARERAQSPGSPAAGI